MIAKLLTVAGVTADRVATFAPIYESRFEEFGLTDPLVQVHYLAQVLHESGYLRWMREIWGPTEAQKRYERDFKKPWDKSQLAYRLGNSMRGDGVRYLGRGDIMRTGRTNYKILSNHTGIDFLNNPALLEQPQYGVLSGVDFWNSNSLTRIAQADDRSTVAIFDKKRKTTVQVNKALWLITHRVNGGYNGLESRHNLFLTMRSLIMPPLVADLEQTQPPTDQPV